MCRRGPGPGCVRAKPNKTMKQKINVMFINKIPLLAIVALGLATTAGAQTSPTQMPVPQGNSRMVSNTPGAANYGLIGQHYYSFDYGYVHSVDGPPDVFHRYSFAANNPLAPGFDAGLKYDWLTGSAFGQNAHQQEVSIPLTAYLYNGWGRPFVEGDAGWLWQKVPGTSTDSFAYLLAAGVELQLHPALVLTPYVNFKEAPHIGAREWDYGAKGTYRFTREWGASLGAQIDDDHNLEYMAGLNFHY